MNARSDCQPQQRLRTLNHTLPYGVYLRRGRAKKYLVKFNRAKRTINIGSYSTLDQAVLAANEWLRSNPR
jgi:hypothetical protein